jgi:two-component system, sensor histidine kinase and response regulator
MTANLPTPSKTVCAEALFQAHQDRIFRQTDRMFARLFALQWLAGIVFAIWVSPLAWTGGTSQLHVHVWAAILLGGAVSLFPMVLVAIRPGRASTRYVIATAQMLSGALLIHLTGGRIETHFHVFGSLAFLAFYRDWKVLVPATVVVALDHMLRGLFWPQSVYGVLVASEWRWVEHAAWVVFENVFLVMACIRGTAELRQIAERTATMEDANRTQARQAVELNELVARLRLSQQEVEAATRAKSEFLANMSHELRTPLNAITLYSELLQETAGEAGRDSDVADLGKIRTASAHLLGLINDILDLSKIEAGKMELDLDTFDVRSVVDELIGTIEPVIRKNGNAFAVRYGPGVSTMRADPRKTRQILFNLLSNAAKFTSNGVVTLEIGPARMAGQPAVTFTVSDTGIGLTDEQKGRLFRPFTQADSSISRKYGGTGLGLALVWRFCQLMGGTISVDSETGKGARFTVTLPVEVGAIEIAETAA